MDQHITKWETDHEYSITLTYAILKSFPDTETIEHTI